MSTKTSVDLPIGILFDPWLKDVEVRVWAAYRARADRNLETTISAGDIAEELGVKRVTVARAVVELTRAGYMVKTTGGGSPNRRLVAP